MGFISLRRLGSAVLTPEAMCRWLLELLVTWTAHEVTDICCDFTFVQVLSDSVRSFNYQQQRVSNLPTGV